MTDRSQIAGQNTFKGDRVNNSINNAPSFSNKVRQNYASAIPKRLLISGKS
ncbi:MAG: hypothetical protein V7K69_29550 [Nostoc sp.]|uniref:hypothetical protein n=1 Tax=Nostoc sp. TaxID=1180 RepID=UPI002FFA79EC